MMYNYCMREHLVRQTISGLVFLMGVLDVSFIVIERKWRVFNLANSSDKFGALRTELDGLLPWRLAIIVDRYISSRAH